MWLVWSLASAVLAAEPTVALPDGEPAEPWHAPLRIAGLKVGASGEQGRLRVVGAQWELCVPRDPAPTCMTLDPPTTDRQREDVAWLVLSLQNELVFDMGGGGEASAGAAATAAAAAADAEQAPRASAPVAVTTPAPVREESVAAVVPASSAPARTVVAESSASTKTPVSLGPQAPSSPPAASPVTSSAPTTNDVGQPEAGTTPGVAADTNIDSGTDTDVDADVDVESAPPTPSRSEPKPALAAVVADSAAVDDSSTAALEDASPPPARSPAPAPGEQAGPSVLRVDELRLGLGARWQVAEGASPFLTGEVRGPVGPLTGAVVTAVDAPITLSEDPLRRTWTATVGMAALVESGALEFGVGAGLEHQRWWQDQSLVEAAFRPQVSVRGGVCPREGWLCVSGLTGWSLRRVTERSDDAAPSVATPLHLSLQVHLRKTRTGSGGL